MALLLGLLGGLTIGLLGNGCIKSFAQPTPEAYLERLKAGDDLWTCWEKAAEFGPLFQNYMVHGQSDSLPPWINDPPKQVREFTIVLAVDRGAVRERYSAHWDAEGKIKPRELLAKLSAQAKIPAGCPAAKLHLEGVRLDLRGPVMPLPSGLEVAATVILGEPLQDRPDRTVELTFVASGRRLESKEISMP